MVFVHSNRTRHTYSYCHNAHPWPDSPPIQIHEPSGIYQAKLNHTALCITLVLTLYHYRTCKLNF